MEIDDGAEVTGTSGRGGGRGRAATLAEEDEQERERFLEVCYGPRVVPILPAYLQARCSTEVHRGPQRSLIMLFAPC